MVAYNPDQYYRKASLRAFALYIRVEKLLWLLDRVFSPTAETMFVKSQQGPFDIRVETDLPLPFLTIHQVNDTVRRLYDPDEESQRS